MIRVEKLTKSFKGRPVFHDIDLTVHDGEIVGIIGPSGTGKSTFLRCLMLLEKPDSGKIYLDDEELTEAGPGQIDDARKRIGMVFQSFDLFPHMTVVENVIAGPVHLKGMQPEAALKEAGELLRLVGLTDKAFEYPDTLSGGQQQRAAIARVLAMQPVIILMDEPTSALDPMMRGEVEAVIRMLAGRGCTMLIVTQEMELVRKICTRVVYVNKGQIYEEGTPEEIFENPKRTNTRRFVRALRVLEFDVQSKGFDFIGSQTEVSVYGYRNGIPPVLIRKLEAVMEELFQMVIIQPKEQNRMHISFEYSHTDSFLSGEIRFTGPKVDPDDPMYFYSWPLIVMYSDTVEIREIQSGGYTNLVRLTLR